MDACLTKPFDARILFRTLDELVPVAGAASLPIDPDSGVVLLENHPRFQPATVGGLNLIALEELLKLGGKPFVAELVDEFAREGVLMLDELQVAVAANDLHMFGERIHALRSCAANIGAQSVFERCVAWRDTTAEELVVHGEDYLQLLRSDFDAALVHLQSFLATELKTGTD
jgi:two-component system sensor histidine kinase RpfC